MSAEQVLRNLGIALPAPPPAAGNYVRGVQVGNLLFMSGCGPRQPDGTYIRGKVGADLSIEQAYQAARLAGLVMLANIRAQLGSLDRVRRVVKVLGMINAAPDFEAHPKVLDGFSDVLVDVFGEAGRGGRAAVGMGSLTKQMAIEVEMSLEIHPQP